MDGAVLWVYTQESLRKIREETHEETADTLRQSTTGKELPALPTLDAGSRLVSFYAQKLPDLCDLCGMPPEVKWTAIVFYQRFFAEHSPFEFEPLFIMFACVHVASKIEEAHEITMDKLLESSDFGTDPSVKAKVADYELPVLEGIGFQLMVEPQPDTVLPMLAEELRSLLKTTSVKCPPALAKFTEEAWGEITAAAVNLVLDLSVRTDAVIRWQTSILCMAALSETLRRHIGEADDSQSCSDALASLLCFKLGSEPQRVAVRRLLTEVVGCIRRLPSEAAVGKGAVKDVAKAARRCHKAFDQIRAEAAKQDEAQRMDRSAIPVVRCKRHLLLFPTSLKDVQFMQTSITPVRGDREAVGGSGLFSGHVPLQKDPSLEP